LSPVNLWSYIVTFAKLMVLQIYLAWVAILVCVDEITLLQDSYPFAVDCTGGVLLSKAP
jgi:hypothetical protein